MKELVKRTVFGVLFVLVVVFGLVIYPTVFPAFCILLIGRGMSEFYTMALGPDHYKFERFFAMLAVASLHVLLFFAVFGDLAYRWAALSLLPLLIMMVGPIFRTDHSDVGNMGVICAGIVYFGLPVALVPFLVCKDGEFSGWLLLGLLCIIWLSDVGAYCLGTLFGQKPSSRKLCPAISPKKSWWGFAGALLFGIGVALAVRALGWMPFAVGHCIALGVIVSAGGVAGDLVESMWKRFFGVKDSGNAIPGHGGLYDRFDSSLVAIPLAAVYMTVFGLL